ncbi:hypothetical protein PanWU01x14_367400 [Parasponia andersonii]|uniref:Uncharacterized protein n=1 Tax=Parasponia andersonii TaxID=3476 RepID=A0A2P5A5D2_PARAD|nr:hypothetical protein PanWU01x14_367400 [Parasponia andersonii]
MELELFFFLITNLRIPEGHSNVSSAEPKGHRIPTPIRQDGHEKQRRAVGDSRKECQLAAWLMEAGALPSTGGLASAVLQ